MRYPAAETAEKHSRILDHGARLFRERGFADVSVSEVMKASGMTHGAFYNHFASKDALVAECLDHACASSLGRLRDAVTSPDRMTAFSANYLSASHRDEPGAGCVLPTLATEVMREPLARAGFTAYVQQTLATWTEYFGRRRKAAARRAAIVRVATMVGAMTLARAVDDEALSEEILREVREALD